VRVLYEGFLGICRDVGHKALLLVAVLSRWRSAWRRRGLIADQAHAASIKVLHVVVLVSFFIGMVVALQTGIELTKIGQQNQIGFIVGVSMAREMGPFITAIIIAATVGSALAAEIGTMAVSEELHALEVLSIDRIGYLILPRVVALAAMAPVLTIVCDTIGILGGGFVANAQLNVGYVLFFDSVVESLQPQGQTIPIPKDVYAGLLKSFVFGLSIAVISCSAGLRAKGGALGVGNATRKAVRDSIITVIIFNYFMTWIFYQA
jgi:phospholipid/cholesterol/gamma-HCH transport system permease protein